MCKKARMLGEAKVGEVSVRCFAEEGTGTLAPALQPWTKRKSESGRVGSGRVAEL